MESLNVFQSLAFKLLGIAVALAAEIAPFSTTTPQTAIHYWAAFYGVSYVEMYNTLKCESGFNPNAIGDGGTSYGIAQFRNPERDWGFTPAQAKDPDFALQQMAKAWSEGKAYKWSCYRSLNRGTLDAPEIPGFPVEMHGSVDRVDNTRFFG